MSDVDKSVPIPKPATSSRKWFGDDEQPRNKVLLFESEWHGTGPKPPSLDTDTVAKINALIADGKEPKIMMAHPKPRPAAKPAVDPLAVTLSALNMKKDGNRFVKDEETECDS